MCYGFRRNLGNGARSEGSYSGRFFCRWRGAGTLLLFQTRLLIWKPTVIASMLLWKRHREVNKVDGAAELMEGTFSTLGAITGKPGRRFPETGSVEHLFTWPQEK